MACLELQQHLPFTVLKLTPSIGTLNSSSVATALTVYGIETNTKRFSLLLVFVVLQQHLPFTVLKLDLLIAPPSILADVATALTVYGIETS